MSGNERKKIMFYDTPERQADLKIRLKYDNMTQSDFFRAMLTGYVEQDPDLIKYLNAYKEVNQIQGINKRKGSARLHEKGQQTKKAFALNQKEIENIFDILEKENPDI
jgi:ABC-type lipoprotein export system ATPase subunit